MSFYAKKKSPQSGAALFVCLVLLTIMTLIGISSVSTTVLEEKMAGNTRNRHLAFQAAEAALREGENAVNLAAPSQFSNNGTDGFYNRSVPGDSSPAYPVWDQPMVNWQDASNANAGLVESPEYIAENFGSVNRDEDCVLILPLPPDCILPVYRVTARGWGLNRNTRVTLQSTYR